MIADEIAEAVAQLKSSGKIIDFGVSNFTAGQCDLIQTSTIIDYNQIQFSLTNYNAMNDGLLDYLQINKIVPMAWNPLGTVFKNNDAQSARIMQAANQMSEKYAVEPDVLLIAWILQHPSGILPVIGTTTATRIAKIAKSNEIVLTLEDWFELYVASMGHKVA